MSDQLTPAELERFLRQLQAQDLEAIGRRLGLDLHGPDQKRQLGDALAKNPGLQKRAQELALTLSSKARCSFCGESDRKVVVSPAGASICVKCLSGFG